MKPIFERSIWRGLQYAYKNSYVPRISCKWACGFIYKWDELNPFFNIWWSPTKMWKITPQAHFSTRAMLLKLTQPSQEKDRHFPVLSRFFAHLDDLQICWIWQALGNISVSILGSFNVHFRSILWLIEVHFWRISEKLCWFLTQFLFLTTWVYL